MRIGIDASSVLDEGTGLENHVLTLVDALARFSDHELVVFVRRKLPRQWDEIQGRLEARCLDTDSQVLATQVLLRRAARRARLDVLYCGAKPAPAGYAGTLLVGIHDPIPWMKPDVMGRGAAPWFRTFHSMSIRHGAHVATPSAVSKGALEALLGLEGRRVHVVGNALAPWYQRYLAGAAIERPAVAPSAPYFLAVRRIDPRSGLSTVLDAWDDLRRRHPHVRLVLAGKAGWKAGSWVERARATPGVTMLGEVSAPDLAGLYRHALGFVTASMHEGFGLTVLEAMALGAPVLATGIPPHLEVGGDAARYFAVGDWTSLSRAMERLVHDEGERTGRVARGKARALVFSAERLATRFLEAAEATAGG